MNKKAITLIFFLSFGFLSARVKTVVTEAIDFQAVSNVIIVDVEVYPYEKKIIYENYIKYALGLSALKEGKSLAFFDDYQPQVKSNVLPTSTNETSIETLLFSDTIADTIENNQLSDEDDSSTKGQKPLPNIYFNVFVLESTSKDIFEVRRPRVVIGLQIFKQGKLVGELRYSYKSWSKNYSISSIQRGTDKLFSKLFEDD